MSAPCQCGPVHGACPVTEAEAKRLIVGLVTACRAGDVAASVPILAEATQATIYMALGLFAKIQLTNLNAVEMVFGKETADRALAEWGADMNRSES